MKVIIRYNLHTHEKHIIGFMPKDVTLESWIENYQRNYNYTTFTKKGTVYHMAVQVFSSEREYHVYTRCLRDFSKNDRMVFIPLPPDTLDEISEINPD